MAIKFGETPLTILFDRLDTTRLHLFANLKASDDELDETWEEFRLSCIDLVEAITNVDLEPDVHGELVGIFNNEGK